MLPQDVREERRARLMELQEQISAARLESKIGRSMQVLVDSVDEDGATARSSADAPDIDGLVYVTDGEHLNVGDRLNVTITDSDTHDLFARCAD
jgi:ribosomal protein S12 methylthiotransferase